MSRLVFLEGRNQVLERLGPIGLVALLIDIDKAEFRLALRCVDILAPLGQSSHLQRDVESFPPFRFNDEGAAIVQLDQEVRIVIRDVSVRVDVVKLEADRKIVLCEGRDIGRRLSRLHSNRSRATLNQEFVNMTYVDRGANGAAFEVE